MGTWSKEDSEGCGGDLDISARSRCDDKVAEMSASGGRRRRYVGVLKTWTTDGDGRLGVMNNNHLDFSRFFSLSLFFFSLLKRKK